MPIGLQIDLVGERQINRTFQGVREHAGDMRGAFAKIHDWLRREVNRQFDSEGRRWGTGWSPLKETTLAIKQRNGLDMRILHATGALRASFVDGRDGIFRSTPTTMEYSSAVPYALFHQTGTSRMPRRAMIRLEEIDKRDIMRIIQTEIMKDGRRW